MIPFDVYVLAGDRSGTTVQRFLRQFGDGMEEAAAEYPMPQFADMPTKVYSKLTELVAYLAQETSVVYSVYFRKDRIGEAVRNAMLKFTSDGRLIVGLTVYAPDTSELGTYLKELSAIVEGGYGYWTVEEPPPSSAVQFIECVSQADHPKLVPESQ